MSVRVCVCVFLCSLSSLISSLSLSRLLTGTLIFDLYLPSSHCARINTKNAASSGAVLAAEV